MNQRVLVKTPQANPNVTPASKRWSPGTQSFLNWRADDPRRSPLNRQQQAERVSQAELDEFLRIAQTDHHQIPNVKAKFARFEANTREERAIRDRANARLRRIACAEQYRRLCEGIALCITCACFGQPPPPSEDPDHTFHADVKSDCKASNAITIEQLNKYQRAREAQSRSPNNAPSLSSAAVDSLHHDPR
eukprot:6792264-Prymnesium_polylepis.1